MALTVLMVAEESAGSRAVQRVADAGHAVPAVLSGGEGVGLGSDPVARAAANAGLTVLPAANVNDPSLPDTIRSWAVDLLLNVHSLHVIPEGVLRAPRIGSFNLHPGPLPRYAGLNALSWAIYRGDREYGTTLHWMEPSIDTGAIAYQTLFEIEDGETALSLSRKCVDRGLLLLDRLIEDASADPVSIPAVPQRLENREYFGKRAVPDGMWVDWEGDAATIERLVRACQYDPFPSPWGKPRALVGERRIDIGQVALTGEACSAPPGSVRSAGGVDVEVATGDCWIRVEKISVDGEGRAPAEVLAADVRLTTGRPRAGGGPVAPGPERASGAQPPPRDRVLRIFEDKLHLEITDDEPDLIESGRLDSLSFVDLVFELEQAFDVVVDLAEVDFADFRSVDTIAAFVQRLREVG